MTTELLDKEAVGVKAPTKRLQIAICIPFYKQMDTLSVQSLLTMLAHIHARGDVYSICASQSMYIDKARAFLVQTAIEKLPDADYILCIDTDHIYTAEALYGLIEAMEANNLEMLSAAYVTRGRPSSWVHLQGEGKEAKGIPVGSVKGITDCTVMGFGFAVFKPAVLKRMWAKHGMGLFAGGYHNGEIQVGDDVRFSDLARAEGIPVKFHADIKVGHIASVVL